MKAAQFAGVAASLAICALIPTSPVRACQSQANIDFSIHLVDGEAGLQPDKPNPQDIKVEGNGHAYWLQPDALVHNDIVSAEVAAYDDGDGFSHPVIVVRLGPEGQRAFAAATTKYLGREFAYVVNGYIIGEPVTQVFPFRGDQLVISGYFFPEEARDMAARLMGERCSKFGPNGAPRP